MYIYTHLSHLGSAADSKESTNPALIVATSFGAAIVVGLGLVVITVILYTLFCKKSKEKYSSKDGTEYYVSSHYSCGVSSKSSDYGHVCLKQVRSKEQLWRFTTILLNLMP